MTEGWIRLYRRIEDNPSWLAEPFTRGQAWVDLLLMANHKPGHTRIRGIKVEVGRGQLASSEVVLANRWQWSRGKVRRFLSELEDEAVQQIEQQKNNVTTLITIKNYGRYQGSDTANGTADGQQTDSKRYSNKKDKKEKERQEEKGSSSFFDLYRKLKEQNYGE